MDGDIHVIYVEGNEYVQSLIWCVVTHDRIGSRGIRYTMSRSFQLSSVVIHKHLDDQSTEHIFGSVMRRYIFFRLNFETLSFVFDSKKVFVFDSKNSLFSAAKIIE
jgi:hypothetical protein